MSVAPPPLIRGVLAAAVVLVSCARDDVLQGDEYQPDGSLPTGPVGVRPDGGCTGGSCDAGALSLPTPATPPSNACETARDVGKVKGDTAAETLTVEGPCSEWVSIRVAEADSTFTAVPMKVRLTLTPTSDFHLYVYLDPAKDVRSCASPLLAGAASGPNAESAPAIWGEVNASISNGSDDSRTVRIAILKTGTPCDATTGGWTLSVEGNR